MRRLSSLADEVRLCGRDEIDFPAALRWLRKEWRVRRIVCEGGGELNDALFRADLVDELHLTVCPYIFGGRDAPTIADGVGRGKLAGAAELECRFARRIGGEIYFVFTKRARRPITPLQRPSPGATADRKAGSGK